MDDTPPPPAYDAVVALATTARNADSDTRPDPALSVAPPAAPAAAAPAWLGRSHWDRLPRELRAAIIDAAGPLTKLTTGTLRASGLFGSRQVALLWRDALACDWTGDIRTLPRVDLYNSCFHDIRSRRMFEQVRSAGLAADYMLRRVAIRRGWADLLDFDEPDALAEEAARQGALWLLAELVDVRRVVRPSSSQAAAAAYHGRLDVVQWLHERMQDEPWYDNVMADAATSGSLALVVWLHERRGISPSDSALGQAVSCGHLHIVRWLLEHGANRCDSHSVRLAAQRGHLDVLMYVHEHLPIEIIRSAASTINHASSLPVVRWMFLSGIIQVLDLIRFGLLSRGSDACADFLKTEFGIVVTQEMFEAAMRQQIDSVAEWIFKQPGIAISESAVEAALAGRCTKTLDAFIHHDPSCLGVIVEKVNERCDIRFVWWLDKQHPGNLTQHTLERAVAGNSPEIVEYLLKNVTGVAWDIVRARHIAETSGNAAMCAVLDCLTGESDMLDLPPMYPESE
ncbi:hypothetical protein HK105_203939 [Polyrhizophydium stewartii]|uniref:Ankyrin repeat domain containing protein n=1 Tax=Polyrhizophydium stewartii TaxID=2732419 RepID=A0ABR4NAG7_9FUNG|nr:hypothetical protein HK105_006298 [Polyrhizophydium stewartii]